MSDGAPAAKAGAQTPRAVVRWADTVRRLALIDGRLLRRYPRVMWAALGVVLVPAAYALIYLTSVWNPSARTAQLPVLVVNADRGAEFMGRSIRLGDELVRRLRERPSFGYRDEPDEAAARHAVSLGEAQFALLIAADFSQRAVPGSEPGAARIVIFTSEGNDYSGANFAKRFAPELARQVNEALNRERWSMVLQRAAGARISLEELQQGVERLWRGAQELAQGGSALRQGAGELNKGLIDSQDGARGLRGGAEQAGQAAQRLSDGVSRAAANLRAVVARLPSEAELQALPRASQALLDGQRQLEQGLLELQQGAERLHEANLRFKAEGERVLLIGDWIAGNVAPLADGSDKLLGGATRARQASGQLVEGTRRLDAANRAAAEEWQQTLSGVRPLVSALPADEELARLPQALTQIEGGAAALGAGLTTLSAGSQRLSAGLQRLEAASAQLTAGLHALISALPEAPRMAGTTPGGLAGSVQPVVEVVAPVPSNGAGFAPNFIAVALWMGATLCSFIWPLRRLPALELPQRSLATALGKMVLPAALAALQALVLLLMLKTLLPLPMPGDWRLALTLVVASVTFLAILLLLVRLLGEVGKAVALLLLVTQISAAGGTLPVALTTEFHRSIHPYIPFTWVIRSLRAAMFGAYGGAWAPAVLTLAAGGVVALVLAAYLGRWKVVPVDEYHPALDMD